jgi:peptide/nickel transport system permease protein
VSSTDDRRVNTKTAESDDARTSSNLSTLAAKPKRFELLRRLRAHPGSQVGAVILAVLVLVAVGAWWVMPYDPYAIDPLRTLQSPNSSHLMGTDNLGRDVLSRMIIGSRISLSVGIISVGISLAIGVPMGLIAGFYGRQIDNVIMRLVDILLAFPGILLALAVVSVLGPGTNNVMIAVGIGAVPTFVRVVRGSVLSAREYDYVEAAKAIGARDSRVMFAHILPNISAPIIVISTLGVASAILAASSLSYLGLGAQPPQAEWGAMLSGARSYMRSAWWLTTFPGLAIMITVLAINMLGDGLRDALDPQLRNR